MSTAVRSDTEFVTHPQVLQLFLAQGLQAGGRLGGQSGGPIEEDAVGRLVMHPGICQELHARRWIRAVGPRAQLQNMSAFNQSLSRLE